jgi:hypothetical protein
MIAASPLIAILILSGLVVAGPPEPAEAPLPEELPESLEIDILVDEVEALSKEILMESGLGDLLEGMESGFIIKEVSIAGDSIVLKLANDSLITINKIDAEPIPSGGKDVMRVRGDVIIEEDEVISGDIVSILGDVTVKGTVKGGVFSLYGNIYVSSTGYIEESAVAFSGIVKKEPGARVGPLTWGAGDPAARVEFVQNSAFKTMGFTLFLVFLIWMILSATCISVFKKNVAAVSSVIRDNLVISFFKGWGAYMLAFFGFIALIITILGMPLAIFGLPLAVLAGMILSFSAISVILGQKLLNIDDLSFKTFLYGSLTLGAVPFLSFFTLMLTGSIVLMIFSWIFVAVFLILIAPVGLWAVVTTRFGFRQPKSSSETQTLPGNS